MDEIELMEWFPLAGSIAREFYIPGSDRDDVFQEAIIGLWAAYRDFDPDLGEFRPFAALCIRRRLTACLRVATRKKHLMLTHSLRSVIGVDEGDSDDAVAIIPHPHTVEDVVEGRERLAVVLDVLENDLTVNERHCVLGVFSGYRYDELGETKAVDNATIRGRNKLRNRVPV